ncbi:MAG: hypothetical protein HXX18_06320 [Bacteroidetes bacterium]|nr:hypothetical protein [Bacteroidota bacterium]
MDKDYQWIFSGIGVSILAIFFAIFKKYLLKTSKSNIKENKLIKIKENNLIKIEENNAIKNLKIEDSFNINNIYNNYQSVDNTDSNSYNTDLNFTDLNPYEIVEIIRKSPVYQQTDNMKNYIGLKFKWILEIYSVDKIDDNIVNISLYPKKRISPLIQFKININEFPAFKTFYRDELLEITGKILEFENISITVEPIKINKI